MITFIVVVIALLFVVQPTVLNLSLLLRGRTASLGADGKLGWLILSFVLRALIAAGVLWLYFGGAVFDRVREQLPSIRVTTLVDTSSSMVSSDADPAGYGDVVAERVAEVLEALELENAQVDVIAFDSGVRALGTGLEAIRGLSANSVAEPGSTQTRLREALASVPPAAPGAGYTILVTDGWQGDDSGEGVDSQELSPDLLRTSVELGQPIISVPVQPQETWRYSQPDDARLVDIGKTPARRFIAGAEAERSTRFALGPASSAEGATSVDLAMTVQGRPELISEYACRDAEARGVGRVTLPSDPGRLIECLPLQTISDPAGAATQARLAVGSTLDQAKNVLDADGGTSTDQVVVQFLERGYVPRVLVLDGSSTEEVIPSVIESSLVNLGWRWDRVTPQDWADARFNETPVDLQRYDAVLLADFPPGSFGLQSLDDFDGDWTDRDSRLAVDQALNGLASYVALGGGLFISGGEESFGVGGYASSAIEPLLPVQLDPKGAAGDPPIVVVAVLDVSASMWYQEETKERGIEYLIGSLTDLPEGSQIRVMGYSDEPHELVPLQEFEGVEKLSQLMDEALEQLGEEFERRRLLGLQPEGLDVYGALTAGYRTFDRLAELAQEQQLLDESSTARSFEGENQVERRLFLIADAQDFDLLTFTRWTVDETGTFVRTNAADLARKRFEDQGVVLNSIGMTYGEGPLPPVEVIAGSENREWRERFTLGQGMAEQLLRLSDAGGGTSYLDQFEIPLGSLSRKMRPYVDDGIGVAPSPNHRFMPGDLVQASGAMSLPGVAIAPAKTGARWILGADYQPESGQPVRLGIWTEWVTEAQNIRQVVSNRRSVAETTNDADGTSGFTPVDAQLDVTGAGGLSFGGAVSVLTTTLRDGNDISPGFSDFALNQVAFIRMLDWLVRTRAQDEFAFTAHLNPDDAEAIDLALDLSSAGDFNIYSASLTLWNLDEADLRTVADEDLGEDALPIDLTILAEAIEGPGVQVMPLNRKGNVRRVNRLTATVDQQTLNLALNDDDAALVDFTIQGVDERGVERELSYRLFVFPKALEYRAETASWLQGLNQGLLRDLAALSGGVHFAPGTSIDLNAAPQPAAVVTTSQIDLRWLVALLMIMAFIADFLVREYRIGREE